MTPGDATFDDPAFGFTFDYPSILARVEPVEFELSSGRESTAHAALALDRRSCIVVMRYDLVREVRPVDLPVVKRELDTVIERLGVGPITGWPVSAGGMHGYEYRFATSSTSSRYVVLFDGDVQYVVNAQATSDVVDAIGRACEVVLASMARR